jgi:hypothetical protein
MSTFPDLTNPNVTGPARAVALAAAVKETLRTAARAEPGRHDEALAKLSDARGLLAELDSELAAWSQS